MLRVKWLCVLPVLLVVLTASGADRAIDFAGEDAGKRLRAELESSDIADLSIAFLPLFGDRKPPDGIYPVVRAELTRAGGRLSYFVRDEREWDKLVAEIDFGARREDVMDRTTIQKFGSIKGVDALLYGDLREATSSTNGGIVRLTVFLSDVETGQQLWSANIKGAYEAPKSPPPPPPPPPPAPTERLLDMLRDNFIVVLGIVGAIVICLMFLKAVTRPR